MRLTAGLYITLFSLSALTAGSCPAAGSPGLAPLPAAAVSPSETTNSVPPPTTTVPPTPTPTPTPAPVPAMTTAPNLQNLYQNPEGKRLPEAIIFYNSANPCFGCQQAINMAVRILRKNYRGRMHAYLIDAAKHPGFISAFKLRGPLNLVLVRISDGASFGYAKISGLQSETGDADAFAALITEKVGNFLNLLPEN